MALYLVTGGAGFIGSHIVEKLLECGHTVRVLDNFSTGTRDNLAKADADGKTELIEGDIRDRSMCEQAVSGADYILHQAALGSIPRSLDNPVTTNDVNIGGILNMLEAARKSKVKRFVFAGSSSSYGDNAELPRKEDRTGHPLSPYALSKLAGEMYCRIYYSLFSVPTVMLRYFNVFGPRQNPSSAYAAVIPSFFSKLLSGAKPVVYGDGEQTRDFTYVENVVNANLLACEASEKILGMCFNIAGGRQTSVNSLCARIQELTGSSAGPEYREARDGDVKHNWASIERASKMLGYRVEVDLMEGLDRSAAYYSDVGSG